MTIKQYRSKTDTARRFGAATLDDGCQLVYCGSHWSLRAKDGNTIDTAHDPAEFEYICDDKRQVCRRGKENEHSEIRARAYGPCRG